MTDKRLLIDADLVAGTRVIVGSNAWVGLGVIGDNRINIGLVAIRESNGS